MVKMYLKSRQQPARAKKEHTKRNGMKWNKISNEKLQKVMRNVYYTPSIVIVTHTAISFKLLGNKNALGHNENLCTDYGGNG